MAGALFVEGAIRPVTEFFVENKLNEKTEIHPPLIGQAFPLQKQSNSLKIENPHNS